jgi:hypothetical protein
MVCRYCYGAPYVCDELSDKGICTAGAFAHPAFLKESHFYNLTSTYSVQLKSSPGIDSTIKSRYSSPAQRSIIHFQMSFETELSTSCKQRRSNSKSSCFKE